MFFQTTVNTISNGDTKTADEWKKKDNCKKIYIWQ